MVFPGPRVAVFVDGCYWHRCPEHGTVPKTNTAWWVSKLAANVRRDRDSDSVLQLAGWAVVRVWEHEVTAQSAGRIEAVVRERSVDGAILGSRPPDTRS